ncbi:PH domain-containing protein [Actinomadura sp. CNU-125]|uniref:PH domain-containing protein n=1 Tax=Actinomadura sp. CNU-125 TaxID=1904961 RepID=UPI000A8BFC24|nr:PH domain-containing protein [Actinomadura sp. CNU-125]
MESSPADRDTESPSAPPEPTPVIVRRLERRSAWAPGAVAAFVGVVFAVVGVSAADEDGGLFLTIVLGVVGAPLIVLGFMVVVGVWRARTEIGPDGVRNRALFAEKFVAWDDVRGVSGTDTAPRVITLVRDGGRNVTLAAVRDDGTAPDGLGFDDIAELVRARASVPADAEPSASARPLSLRPSRRPLLWIVPVWLLAGVGVLQADRVVLVFFGTYFVWVAVFVVAHVLKLLRGRTDADADGLRNRLMLRTRTFAWRDVQSLTVTATLFGRITVVRLAGGKRFHLAAPREGLLGRDPRFDDALETMRALAGPDRRVVVSGGGVRAARIVLWVLLLIPLAAGVAGAVGG